MTRPATYPNFQAAYVAVLAGLTSGPTYANNARGNASREQLGVTFRIEDPRDRLVLLGSRRANVVYHFAEALWYLGGRNDLAMIAHYAPRRRADSVDGRTIGGSAYGARMFAAEEGRPPFNTVLDLLSREPDSKRAFLPVFRLDDLAEVGGIDVPCLLGLQLLLRGDALHMVCHMRANDADRGMLADVFSFTMIQEAAARRLGVGLGTYIHQVGSMHVAVSDIQRVRRVLAEADDLGTVDRPEPLTMPKDTSPELVEHLLAIEARVREGSRDFTPARIAVEVEAPYWQQVLLLFEAHRQLHANPGREVHPDVLDALEPVYRDLLLRRWPRPAPTGTER